MLMVIPDRLILVPDDDKDRSKVAPDWIVVSLPISPVPTNDAWVPLTVPVQAAQGQITQMGP